MESVIERERGSLECFFKLSSVKETGKKRKPLSSVVQSKHRDDI